MGRCIKMLQISCRSRAESSILQVAWVNIFAVPIYPCIFVGLRSFSRSHGEYCSEGRGSSRRITIEAGRRRSDAFIPVVTGKRGAPPVSHLGPLLQILISIFPLFCFRGPFEIFSKDPWLTCTQWACVYLHIFTITTLAPKVSIISCVLNIWM